METCEGLFLRWRLSERMLWRGAGRREEIVLINYTAEIVSINVGIASREATPFLSGLDLKFFDFARTKQPPTRTEHVQSSLPIVWTPRQLCHSVRSKIWYINITHIFSKSILGKGLSRWLRLICPPNRYLWKPSVPDLYSSSASSYEGALPINSIATKSKYWCLLPPSK